MRAINLSVDRSIDLSIYPSIHLRWQVDTPQPQHHRGSRGSSPGTGDSCRAPLDGHSAGGTIKTSARAGHTQAYISIRIFRRLVYVFSWLFSSSSFYVSLRSLHRLVYVSSPVLLIVIIRAAPLRRHLQPLPPAPPPLPPPPPPPPPPPLSRNSALPRMGNALRRRLFNFGLAPEVFVQFRASSGGDSIFG